MLRCRATEANPSAPGMRTPENADKDDMIGFIAGQTKSRAYTVFHVQRAHGMAVKLKKCRERLMNR